MLMIAEILVTALIVIGGLFALIGSWGLTKLPSLMTRLHGPTKATTLGVGSALIASMIYFPVFEGAYSAHELLITLFLFLTAPVTANMIAKAHLHLERQTGGLDASDDPLPESVTGAPWATYGALEQTKGEPPASRTPPP